MALKKKRERKKISYWLASIEISCFENQWRYLEDIHLIGVITTLRRRRVRRCAGEVIAKGLNDNKNDPSSGHDREDKLREREKSCEDGGDE